MIRNEIGWSAAYLVPYPPPSQFPFLMRPFSIGSSVGLFTLRPIPILKNSKDLLSR